ncbi:MAG: hypothetical protein ACK5NT_12705 [Pyrinomonadaceae bacterium]
MKVYFLGFFIIVFALAGFAQDSGALNLADYGVEVIPDKRLITVLTVLEIGGFNSTLSSEGNELRAKIKNDFATLDPELKSKLEVSIQQYKSRHPRISTGNNLSAFVALAYSLSDAPEFRAPERSLDMPDELLEVLDFAPIVSKFYSLPGVATKIESYYDAEKKLAEKAKPSARVMVREVLDYLHTKPELIYVVTNVKEDKNSKKKNTKIIEKKTFERSFLIVPSYLAPKDTVLFLNIKEDYIAVVPPDIDLSESQARRGYLQFVFDPLVLSNAGKIIAKSAEIRELLDRRRETDKNISPDVILAVSRSLVAATDAKETEFNKVALATQQARNKIALLANDTEKRETVKQLDRLKQTFADETALALSQSYEGGAVLAFYFADKLSGIEDSGFDVGSSVGVWFEDMNPKAELNRLQEFAEARNRAIAEQKQGVTTSFVTNPLTEALKEVDKKIDNNEFANADNDLNALLAKFPAGEARISYAQGRNASRSAVGITDATEVNRRLLKARGYFQKVLTSSTLGNDNELAALAYVSLGRIYEFYDQKEYAAKLYDAAMRVGSPDGEGFKTAFDAKKKLLGN